MLKNKLLILSLMISVSMLSVKATETLSDVGFPKAPAYRVGISEIPETQFIQAKQESPKIEKAYAKIDDSANSNIADLTYADLSIKRLSKEVAQDLEMDEQDMVADLSLLWQGAATQSDTINFALYKLANPDADKPDSKSVKKVLSTIASMSTLVGASMCNPVFAGSSLIGSNILGIMSQDTKALNYKYTRVTDADMIILIRKVEDLQQNAVNLYYDYMCAQKQLDMTTKLVEDRQNKFNLAQKNNAPKELVVITDAYYRSALDKQRTAKSEFFSKRAALEQFVGNETFVQFEQDLAARANGETPVHVQQAQDAQSSPQSASQPSYGETVQNVENYTNNLNKQSATSAVGQSGNNNDEEDEDFVTNKAPELQPLNSKTEKSYSEYKSLSKTSNPKKKELKQKKFGKFSFPVRSKKVLPKTSQLDNPETLTANIEEENAKYASKGFIFLDSQGNPKQPTASKVKPQKAQITQPVEENQVEVKNKKTKAPKVKKQKSKTSNEQNQDTQPEQVQSVQPQQTAQPLQNSAGTSGLMPLDAIRVPELTEHGYSIFQD